MLQIIITINVKNTVYIIPIDAAVLYKGFKTSLFEFNGVDLFIVVLILGFTIEELGFSFSVFISFSFF